MHIWLEFFFGKVLESKELSDTLLGEKCPDNPQIFLSSSWKMVQKLILIINNNRT